MLTWLGLSREGDGFVLGHVLWRHSRHLGGTQLSDSMQMEMDKAVGGGMWDFS